MAGGVTNHKSIVQDRVLADVPPSIGPVVFGTLGVGWVMARCPQQYDELMRRAGVFGSPARGNGCSSAGGSGLCSASWSTPLIRCSGGLAFTWTDE